MSMYRPVLVTGPSDTPVSRTEVKAQLDISYTDKDALIDGLIAAAVSYLDGWTGILGRALMSQTWRQDFEDFCRDLPLPLFPVASITSVKYDDVDGVEQTISNTNYTLLTNDCGSYVHFKDAFSLPSVQSESGPRVRVAYVAGYADAANVPAAIKQAMFLMIRQWFDNPSAAIVGATVEKMPHAVDALLAPYRRTRF